MIEIKVPATSANLGPGFDSMGLALELYNTFQIGFSDSGFKTTIINKSDKKEIKIKPENNLVIEIIKDLFEKFNRDLPGLELKEIVDIPFTRGLGSSATAVLAGILGANYLLGHSMSDEQIMRTAVEYEGHPDNVIPALKGGLVINAFTKNENICFNKINVEQNLKIIVVVPEFSLKTSELRQIIPKKIHRNDAVFNHSRTALLTSCFCKNDYSLMAEAMKDKIHQDYRAELIPGFKQVLDAAYSSGACGAALSGAGPSIIAFTLKDPEKVGRAMEKAFYLHNVQSDYFITGIDNKGTFVLK